MTWAVREFRCAFQTVSDLGRRVKQKEYLTQGTLAVVDQGEALIGGYTDDLSMKVNRTGPLIVFGDHTRRVKYVDFDFAVGADGVKLLKPADDLDPKFAFWFLQSVRLPGRGYGRHFALLRETSVPVPAPGVQRRIVDLLEDHLSRLDAADAYLDTCQRRLDAIERAALSECRDGNGRPLDEVAAIQGGIQKQQKRAPRENAYPFLRVANVTARGLDLAEVHQVELFAGELDRLRLQAGDLLVVEGNGSASQIGRAAVWDGSIQDCVHQNHLIRVRPLPGLDPRYLEAVWNSPRNRAFLTDLASSSSGLHTLSVSKLKRVIIPTPPICRQRELVAKLDAARAARSRLATAIEAAQVRRSALRRSLLAAAFSGRLTESASDLSVRAEMIPR